MVSKGKTALKKEDPSTQEFLENILESMDGGVLTLDKKRRITSFNKSAEEITGFKREEVLNQDCCDILKSEICEKACPLEKILETGAPVYSYEIEISNKAGNKIPVNITTSPLRSNDN